MRVDACLTLRNELSEDTCVDKARAFIGKGHQSGEQGGKGNQENCSATWLAVPGFMVIGLVSVMTDGTVSLSFIIKPGEL